MNVEGVSFDCIEEGKALNYHPILWLVQPSKPNKFDLQGKLGNFVLFPQ
jgi:hypothetical protein